MNKASKIWLVVALVLCVCTTAMNTMEGRLLSAGIAVVSIVCLCVLLFAQKKRSSSKLSSKRAISARRRMGWRMKSPIVLLSRYVERKRSQGAKRTLTAVYRMAQFGFRMG